MRKKRGIANPPEHYPLVIISDTHLGRPNDAADLLCEFLRNTRCDRLILNGDIIDGRRLITHASAEFPEVQKRVLDAINRKIAEGTEVIYIPGNHDIELRQMGLFGKTVLGMRFEKSLDLVDPRGRRLLIAHGDFFDAMEAKNIHAKMPPALYRIGDRLNLLFNKASATIDKVADKLRRRPLTLIGRVRHAAEKLLGSQKKREQLITDHARKNGYDGVICGHFHVEAIKAQKDGVLYLNSGDWVVNFTALTLDKNGDWGLVRWPEKRRELGLKRNWRAAVNDNPDKGFRPATEDMLKAVRKTWPGRDKKPPKPPKP
jgi:UDP-2,3-diacylglucosamine pyrophosphatase LpxH